MCRYVCSRGRRTTSFARRCCSVVADSHSLRGEKMPTCLLFSRWFALESARAWFSVKTLIRNKKNKTKESLLSVSSSHEGEPRVSRLAMHITGWVQRLLYATFTRGQNACSSVKLFLGSGGNASRSSSVAEAGGTSPALVSRSCDLSSTRSTHSPPSCAS